ncbi:glycoside hydrolase family 3 protein [Candidatus Phycosocius spiralis]|uniref:Glucan 1,4-beta-glucosidase n=1 Tax=Candidatus Phycosocius spiralis TaxID=2815099 RepID=A0ABQ4PXU8_9PROT|nr:glycoside hydrolase family 3 N-terminal domain-containing protein [Candidatus Phycosocius spiralis]GIU67795.1 glucan 1,4-beta-glucosidase [Candidatus Phycosocius spiralis]
MPIKEAFSAQPALTVPPPLNRGERPVDVTRWPKPHTTTQIDMGLEDLIEKQLAQMTLPQKVAQIIQADIASITPEEAKQYHIGAILNGGNSAPASQMDATAQQWLDLVDSFWSYEEDQYPIPIVFGTDAVHGHSNIAGATIFPHNINLGATRDQALVTSVGVATAREIAVTGMDWTFSPTLAVAQDLRWGRTYEAFSCDPALVGELGGALIRGLQGTPGHEDFLGDDKVGCAAKHFLGDGGTKNGRDQGETDCDEDKLIAVHAMPYVKAIEAGVVSVMASFSSWGGQGMHGRRDLLSDVLKRHWRFDGLVAGDWNGHGQLPGCSPSFAPQSLLAGLDMYMAPDSWQGLLASTIQAVEENPAWLPRLDDAVKRMLRFKARLKLATKGRPSQRSLAGRFDLLACDTHRQIARKAVRASAVLLKNAHQFLPLSRDQRILVCGRGANRLDLACGGWTLSWQGGGDLAASFPKSQTFLAGVRAHMGADNAKLDFAENGQWVEKPDVAIIVLAEEPYAEFRGDCDSLDYRPGDLDDYHLIQRLKDQGIGVVTILYSGRPLWINPALNASDAFVAAFLPGTEAGALADLLFGTVQGERIDFSGQLPFPWPAFGDQFDVCSPSPSRPPLFPLGYGLTLKDRSSWKKIHEVAGRVSKDPCRIFDRGVAQGDWQFSLCDHAGQGGAIKVLTGRGVKALGGGLHVKAIDYGQQENAISGAWRAKAQLIFEYHSQGEIAVDLRRESNAGYGLCLSGLMEQGESLRLALLGAWSGLDETAMAFFLPLSGAVRQGDTFVIALKQFENLGIDLKLVRFLVIAGEAGASLTLAKAIIAPVTAGVV